MTDGATLALVKMSCSILIILQCPGSWRCSAELPAINIIESFFNKIDFVILFFTEQLYSGAFHQLSVADEKLAMRADLHLLDDGESQSKNRKSFTVVVDVDERYLERGTANERALTTDGFLQVDLKLLYAPS